MKKIKGLSGLNTRVMKTCPDCEFSEKVSETKPIICPICVALKDKRVVMIKTEEVATKC